MWFKNLSNTVNTTLSRPTKLLRLDSKGETIHSENSDGNGMPSIQVITRSCAGQTKLTDSDRTGSSCHSCPFKPINVVNRFSSCGLVQMSRKPPVKDCDSPVNTKMTNIDNPGNMYCDKMKATTCSKSGCSWVSWPNHGRNPYYKQNGLSSYQNNFGYQSKKNFNNSRFNAHRLHPDSPWLQVNSGYYEPYLGSNDYFYKHQFQNKVSSASSEKYHHKSKMRHKKYQDGHQKPQSSVVDPQPQCTVQPQTPVKTAEPINEKNPVANKTETVKEDINHNKTVPIPNVQSRNPQSSSHPVLGSGFSGSINSCLTRIDSMENPDIENFNIDSCVADLFLESDTDSDKTNTSPNTNCKSAPSPSQSEKSAMNPSDNAKHQKQTISQIHLSIIGKKRQSNKEKISSEPKVDSAETGANSEDTDKNDGQQKPCTICTAYISRTTPDCKEFPKSAGCKHSIILLVRDNTKKTKKRRNGKEKSMHSSSQKSFIVGVESKQSPENSHVFHFIASDTSDTDDSWDSFDEDEVDGACSGDWSNIEMEELFPGSNGLLNPFNLTVKISTSPSPTTPTQSTTNCPPSPTKKYLETVNLSWNIQILDESKKPFCSKNSKKVHFEDDKKLAVIHPIIAWSYAYRACRKGPWEQYARDRERFQRRICEIEPILSPVLKENHRSQIYSNLYAK